MAVVVHHDTRLQGSGCGFPLIASIVFQAADGSGMPLGQVAAGPRAVGAEYVVRGRGCRVEAGCRGV